MLRLLILLGILIFGGVMIWHGLTDAHEARASEHWPTVDGKVLSHRVERHAHTKTNDTFVPIVWYAYTVGDTPYKDSRISWYEERFQSERAALDFMNERFPIDRAVLVHYDPDHPHHACLIPGGGHRAMIPVYAAVTMMVVAVVVFAFVILRARRGPQHVA